VPEFDAPAYVGELRQLLADGLVRSTGRVAAADKDGVEAVRSEGEKIYRGVCTGLLEMLTSGPATDATRDSIRDLASDFGCAVGIVALTTARASRFGLMDSSYAQLTPDQRASLTSHLVYEYFDIKFEVGRTLSAEERIPLAHLTGDNIRAFKSDPELSRLGMSIISRVVTLTPINAEQQLRDIATTMQRLAEVPKYKQLGESALRRATGSNSRNPESFLDQVIDTIDRLSQVEAYAELGSYIIKRAALGNPRNPDKFLDQVIQTTERLLQNPAYAELGASTVRDAAVSRARKPEQFLDQVIQTTERLLQNPAYAELGTGAVTRAATKYPSDPESYLRTITDSRKM
jgi:hypothetical protein